MTTETPATTSTTTTSPQTFRGEHDTYEILSQLGSGGFGITHKARRVSDGRQVVVKALRVERMDDWKALELFEREMKTLEALDHPGVPDYIDHFEMDSGLAFVQEFVDGEDLGALRRTSRFTLQEHLRWFDQVLEILEYLHGLSPPVVHRDITPGNILLGTERPYLIDFGNVQAAVFKESQSTVAGTLGFAPMEQFVGRAGPRSDLYSLAMTFLSVASGRDPSQMPIEGVQVQVRQLLADQNPDARLTLLLEEMTRPDLNHRIANATEARRRLAPLLGGQATALVLPEPTGLSARVAERPPEPFDAAGWAAALLEVPDASYSRVRQRSVNGVAFSDDGVWALAQEPRALFHTGGQKAHQIRQRGTYITRDGEPGSFPGDNRGAVGAVDPGGQVVAACDGNKVHIHDRRSGARNETLTFIEEPEHVAFSPDGAVLFVHPKTALVDGVLRKVPMKRAFYSPDGRFIIGTGRFGNTAVHLYENREGLPGASLGRCELHFCSWGRFSADGRWAVFGNHWNVVVATTEPFEVRWFLKLEDVDSAAVSAGNRWLLVSGRLHKAESSLVHVFCLQSGHYAGSIARRNKRLVFLEATGELLEVEEALALDREVVPAEGGLVDAVQRFVVAHVESPEEELVEEAMELGHHVPLVLAVGSQGGPRFQRDQKPSKLDAETFRHHLTQVLQRDPDERQALLHQMAEGASSPQPGWWRADLVDVSAWKNAAYLARIGHPNAHHLKIVTDRRIGRFRPFTWVLLACLTLATGFLISIMGADAIFLILVVPVIIPLIFNLTER